jgi:O-methyltransferase
MDALYRTLQGFAAKCGYNFEVRVIESDGFPRYVEPHFLELLKKYRDKTMVPWGGLHMVYRSAQYVARNHVPGAIVECGVWRGGCSLLMAEAIAAVGRTDYDFYLYDTFAGMSEPAAVDTSSFGDAKTFWRKASKKYDTVDWCYASLEEVRGNIAQAAYPQDRFRCIVGKVEDTIPATVPEQIALLRLDTDWYESTRHEMAHLFPRLSKGAVFVCDDYGFWAGAKQAVDEYLASLSTPFLLIVDSGTGRAIGIRQ